MFFKTIFFVLLMLFAYLPAYGSNLYKWVDEKGITHFTDNPSKIPKQNKSTVEVREMPEPEILAPAKSIKKPGKIFRPLEERKKEVPENYGLQKGDIPPGFALNTLEGKKMNLGNQKGKVVFLNFWATWCGPCRREMPSMEKLYRKMNKNFAMMAISDEKKSKVEKFIRKNGYSFPVLIDDKKVSNNKYMVTAIPTTYILGREGKILYKKSGGVNWADPKMIKWFQHITK